MWRDSAGWRGQVGDVFRYNINRFIHVTNESNVNPVMEPHVSLVQFAESVPGGGHAKHGYIRYQQEREEKKCVLKGLRHVNGRPGIGLLLAGGGHPVSPLCRFLFRFAGGPVWVLGWGGALGFGGLQPLHHILTSG